MPNTGKKVEKQFLRLYDQNADAIFRYCYFRLFDHELAKEFAQEVFLRGWREFSDHAKKIKYPKALLYKIANNLIIDYKRKRKEKSLETMQENGFEITGNSLEAETEIKIEYQKILESVNQLPKEYKEIIVLRYVEGLKPKEISEITGQSTNVISVSITRGKKKLKELLK